MITQGRFNREPAGEDAAPDDDLVGRLRREVDELRAYILHQWAVRADRALLGVRRLAIMAIVAATALLALSAWIVTAVVLLLQGATGGLASVLDGRIWLASLIVGASAIAMIGLVATVMFAVWAAASKRRIRMKYERRQSEQRRRFGHSAHDRAL
jgi:ABC-type multidrug transport system fused ATPase/permease subunit